MLYVPAMDNVISHETLRAAQVRAGELAALGVAEPEIERALMDDYGLDRRSAAIVVGELVSSQLVEYEQDANAQARKHMIVGGLWCAGGIAVTAATYSAAEGGGTYVVAWGAIVFGAIEFFRGLLYSQR